MDQAVKALDSESTDRGSAFLGSGINLPLPMVDPFRYSFRVMDLCPASSPPDTTKNRDPVCYRLGRGPGENQRVPFKFLFKKSTNHRKQ